jgi:aspartate aminotransferase, mitochondrial
MRLFVKDGHDIAVAQSFAKNFGLYGERVGCFRFVCTAAPRFLLQGLIFFFHECSMVGQTTEETDRLLSQIKILIRPM